VQRLTEILAGGLTRLGFKIKAGPVFDSLRVLPSGETESLRRRALEHHMNLRYFVDGSIGIALDETTTRKDIDMLFAIFADGSSHDFTVETLDQEIRTHLPQELRRKSPILQHPVFNSFHSETEMLRYITHLQSKDLTLANAMIPLGSCTMKLNATAEMIPITWPEICRLHPFAPLDQVQGSLAMIHDLEDKLCDITGFTKVSLQPNAGSQGEYAGLLVIRRYHESRGEAHRNVCLIPSSAHGTNPASAAMAGMQVVVVKCDHDGNVDLADLKEKAQQHRQQLAALMVTYPSTHGVFEEGITQICEIVHANGGQVYMDGANLNALVGVCRPAEFGADVSHMNLHKTFCIPHGGGGPGVGPIGVRAHLADFLPTHSVIPQAGPLTGTTAVSSAPWGSAGILPISWAYITMMGSQGLKKATQVAILNANYIAHRLQSHYPVVYRGPRGLVAHECILDLRPLDHVAGVKVDDVAKRLMDYGFHAPTMSWPVIGTLMIEPTESESKAELDRFCEAMIAIREEAREIEQGQADREQNVLKNAPHTITTLTDNEWTKPYSRQKAAYPLAWVREHKFWVPVSRVNNPHGDRHLVCACPPLSSYQ
jgi:glycine dehydrogenase